MLLLSAAFFNSPLLLFKRRQKSTFLKLCYASVMMIYLLLLLLEVPCQKTLATVNVLLLILFMTSATLWELDHRIIWSRNCVGRLPRFFLPSILHVVTTTCSIPCLRMICPKNDVCLRITFASKFLDPIVSFSIPSQFQVLFLPTYLLHSSQKPHFGCLQFLYVYFHKNPVFTSVHQYGYDITIQNSIPQFERHL